MTRQAKSAIVGYGNSTFSRKPGPPVSDHVRTAVINAVEDAGIEMADVDGLILGQSDILERSALTLAFRHMLDLGTLNLLCVTEGKGTTMLQAVQHATMAIKSGVARKVVCVFGDTPIGADTGAGETFARPSRIMNLPGWEERYGCYGAMGAYALAASAYKARYGLGDDAFAPYVMACRNWAGLNPDAFLRKPLSLDDYLASPFVVEPIRLFDCAYPLNGAVAFVVSDIEDATSGLSAPVYLHGMGQGHGARSALYALCDGGETGARSAADRALAMAGVSHQDIDICQLYDAFSFSGLYGLEDFGFCAPGTAPAFVAAGETSPGGRLPVNTGGGHLSGGYLQGATPLLEAVVQARDAGGERQVDRHDLLFVSNSGGCLEYHATLVVSPHEVL